MLEKFSFKLFLVCILSVLCQPTASFAKDANGLSILYTGAVEGAIGKVLVDGK